MSGTSDYSRFWLCSGVVPCDVVREIALKESTDAVKILNHIKCKGSQNERFLEQIRQEIINVSQKAKEDFREGMKKFIGIKGAVREKRITDFPELLDYARGICKSLAGAHEADKKVIVDYDEQNNVTYGTPVEGEMAKLEKVRIYLADRQKFYDFFDEDVIEHALGNVGGFYSPAYSLLDWPSVFVLTNRTSSTFTDSVANTIGECLGIPPSGEEITMGEENTLWHEMAHHLFNSQFGENRPRGNKEFEYENAQKWMTNPDELVAMQHGNLPYIQRKLTTFFNSIYPFDGRITQGIIEQIKSEIIESFSMEFHGMDREEAKNQVSEVLGQDGRKLKNISKTAPRDEQIESLVSMFSTFFMQKELREKLELRILHEQKGKRTVEFAPEPVPPEPIDDYTVRNQKSEAILFLEKRQDFQKFTQEANNRIKMLMRRNPRNPEIKPYLRRGIWELEDLLMYLFPPPWTIDTVNTDEKNSLFYNLIPNSLFNDVADIVQKERIKRTPQTTLDKPTAVTPDEAEELGKFIPEMAETNGPEWYQVAGDVGKFYKTAINKTVSKNYATAITNALKQFPASQPDACSINKFLRSLYSGE